MVPRAHRAWLEPVDRCAVRALVLDENGRTLLVQFRDDDGQVWWTTPGGGIDEGEDVEAALRRELAEELGLDDFELGPEIWTREHTFAWRGTIHRQRERIWLVEIARHEPAPRVDLAAELVVRRPLVDAGRARRRPRRRSSPSGCRELLRDLRENGPPAEPFDVGV